MYHIKAIYDRLAQAGQMNELQNSPEFFSPGHFSPDITLQQKIIPEQNYPGHYCPEDKTLRYITLPRTKLSRYKFLPVQNCPRQKTLPAGITPKTKLSLFRINA